MTRARPLHATRPPADGEGVERRGHAVPAAARRGLLAGLLLGAAIAFPAAAERFSIRIVNGSLDFGDPSVAVLLRGDDPERAPAWCTGTLVGCRTVVTAAHCVCEVTGAGCQTGPGAPDPSEWHVFFQHAGFFAVDSIAVHPDFAFPVGDVAVVRLASDVTGIAPSALAGQDPPIGSAGTIVGFGRAGGSTDDYGLKRRGAVVTAACTQDLPEGLVCWSFEAPLGDPGTNSNTCNGDSGGPLFVDFGSGPELAGITSGGTSDDCLPDDLSYDTSVALQRPFVEAAAAGTLGTAACGDLPPAGDEAAPILGFTGSLDAGKPAGEHAFDVPEDTRRLRVALNASEENGADFDLYVRAGSPPTLSEWDCRAFGSSQYGFCEFGAPAAGPWHVRVNRFAGAATYQVTATLFSEGGSPPPPPAAGPQSKPQRRCLNALAEAGARVAGAQTADADACIRHFARGRTDLLGRGAQARTAQACVGNDVDGRVGRALERTLRRDEARCLERPAQLPDFAYRGAGPVNLAARGGVEQLLADLFGPDLDAALASQATAADAARCQEVVAEDAARVYELVLREAADAQRRALRGRGALAPSVSAATLAGALAAELERDPNRRIARATSRALRRMVERCPADDAARAALFPGACASEVPAGATAACAVSRARCRACAALGVMEGLALDCDVFDDGTPDLSCP